MILFTIIAMLYARVALWGPTLYNDDVRVVFRAEQGYGGGGTGAWMMRPVVPPTRVRECF